MQKAIYILAGGKSTRMGSDKALLMLGKKCILQHIIHEALQVSSHVYLVSNHNRYSSFGIPIISDELLQKGPAGGIDAMLQHTQHDYNLVLSCDMPFMDRKSMNKMFATADDYDISYTTMNDYPEMMFSIIRKQCKTAWRNLVEQGELKLSNLIKQFTCQVIDGKEFLQENEFLYQNINTHEDYAKALQVQPIQDELQAEEVAILLQHPDVQVIDVRNEEERPLLSIKHQRIPMMHLKEGLPKLDSLKPTVFICHAGIRSREAVDVAHDEFQFQAAFHLKGGLLKASDRFCQ